MPSTTSSTDSESNGEGDLGPFIEAIEKLDFGDYPRSAETVELKDVELGEFIAVFLNDGTELYFKVTGASDFDNFFEDKQIIAETCDPDLNFYRVRIDGGVKIREPIILRFLDGDGDSVVRSAKTAAVVKILVGTQEEFENQRKKEAMEPERLVSPTVVSETLPGEKHAAEGFVYLFDNITYLPFHDTASETLALSRVGTALRNVVRFVGGEQPGQELDELIRRELERLRAEEREMVLMGGKGVDTIEKEKGPTFGIIFIPLPGNPDVLLRIDARSVVEEVKNPDIRLVRTDATRVDSDKKYQACLSRLKLITPDFMQ